MLYYLKSTLYTRFRLDFHQRKSKCASSASRSSNDLARGPAILAMMLRARCASKRLLCGRVQGRRCGIKPTDDPSSLRVSGCHGNIRRKKRPTRSQRTNSLPPLFPSSSYAPVVVSDAHHAEIRAANCEAVKTRLSFFIPLDRLE